MPLNNSQLKVPLNSDPFSTFQKELLLIFSKPRRRKTTLSFTSEEFSLWMIARNSFPIILVSSKVLLTLKISPLTSQENSFNKIKSLKSSRRTSLKNVLNSLLKSLKMLRIIKSSMNNLPKILSLVFMKTLPTEVKLLTF